MTRAHVELAAAWLIWAAVRIVRAAWWLLCAAAHLARCLVLVLVAVLFGYRYGAR